MPRPALPRPLDRASATRAWRRVRDAQFHDYTRAAFAMWAAIVAAGTAAFCAALATWATPGAPSLPDTLAGLLMVAAAAWFPVGIPRSKYSIGVADAFIFTILALLGPAPAVLAAGVEGAVGAGRTSKRLTSRISTPMAAMAAMVVCGAGFEALSDALQALGCRPPVARLAALPFVALIPFVLTSLSLMSTVTLKRGRWPDAREWFADSTWVAALCIASALLAGMVQLGTAGQGLMTVAIIGTATLAVVVLLNRSLARNEMQHRAQEERIQAAQREAQSNHQRFVGAFQNAAIGMALVEPGGTIVRANQSLCELLQQTESDLVGQPFHSLLHPRDVDKFHRYSRDIAANGGGSEAIEMRCHAADDSERWIALHGGRFSDPDGLIDGLIYQLHDITSRRRAEQRLHHIAFHDGLTDLANRTAFHEKVEATVQSRREDPSRLFAVMFLDLDRFKVVNDSLGHLAGNELLREIGQRLKSDLRQGDLVARLGGDEFAVLLQGMSDHESYVRRAERMLADLSTPFWIQGHELLPIASAGLTFGDLGDRSVDELLRDADLAMYDAKSSVPGRVAVFDRSMHARIADKLALETDLRHAIASGELTLEFQPLFELNPYRLSGFEALARWMHPTRGAISPGVFIALAEESGQIAALSEWALDTAMRQLAEWHRAVPHMAHLGVQVNISGRDLSQLRFVEQSLELLRQHSLAPRLLTLEITESVLMNHIDRAGEVLGRLRASGVQLAIDDFGTGYSSLAYLRRLPIDSLKIDRSFVWAMDQEDGVEIVRAVTNLGGALGKKVIAEGIESPEQLQTLRRLGVNHGQGFLLSRPLRPQQVISTFAPTPAPCVEDAEILTGVRRLDHA